jgi:hypothetical protein
MIINPVNRFRAEVNLLVNRFVSYKRINQVINIPQERIALKVNRSVPLAGGIVARESRRRVRLPPKSHFALGWKRLLDSEPRALRKS